MALSHIKPFQVGRNQQAIGFGSIKRNAANFPTTTRLRIEAIDRLMIQFQIVGLFAAPRPQAPLAPPFT